MSYSIKLLMCPIVFGTTGLLLNPALATPPGDLVASVEQVTVKKTRARGTVWFHPRGCTLPDGAVLWTLQDITGSDHFGPVHWMLSRDNGQTWSDPKPVPAFGRNRLPDGREEGVCDVVPEYHARSGIVLAMGHSVNYRNNKFFVEQPPRWPVYCVRGKNGEWSEAKKLIWNDPRAAYIYSSGCAQRYTLPDGDILVPVTFGATRKMPRSVTTLRCGFDGKMLTVKKVGVELKGKVARGFLEPSIAKLGDTFYLTIRAEDGKGYVSTSADGLAWSAPQAWAWDDGTAITMSTTQQRWLVHSEALYLVYTRKAPENAKVTRWRAPLYMARMNPATRRLMKSTERIAVPMVGDGVNKPREVAHLGNFHTQMVTADESWVTVGEVIPATYRGDLLMARVKWSAPNQLALPKK